MDEFFRTMMGRRFFEHTVPEIATQLKRIADALEQQNKPRHVPQCSAGSESGGPRCALTEGHSGYHVPESGG